MRRLLPLVLLLACNCYRLPDVADPDPGYVRTEEVQEGATVAIMVVCLDPTNGLRIGGGSGVIVGPKAVLTAYHVVTCAGPVMVRADDTLMTVTIIAVESDIARLERVEGSWPAVRPVIGERPQPGTAICLSPAIPKRERACGLVEKFDDLPGDVVHGAFTVPGNSGSGVYANGLLVGIVTHYRPEKSGGCFSSLKGREWLL